MHLTMSSITTGHHSRPVAASWSSSRRLCGGKVLKGRSHMRPFRTEKRRRLMVVHSLENPGIEVLDEVFRRVYASGTGISEELKASLDQFIQENKVVLFMKGTKDFPQCGFSNTCVQILNMMEVPYETVNILESDVLREGMKVYSQWPTFPQTYIDGEFFGGCDIMIESFQSGELKETLERAMNS